MAPFDLLPPAPADRRGREPDRNAWVELHNVVVAAGRLDELGPEHADRIRRERGVDLRDAFLAERVDLYERLLRWALAQTPFGEEQRQRLGAVARTLRLDPHEVRGPHERAFGTAIHDALADDCLDVDERLHLYRLQHALGLDPSRASGAYESAAREKWLVLVARSLCDGELSPEESAEIEQVRRGLDLAVPEPVRQRLDAAARRWQVAHGELPVLRDPAVPDPEEPVHFAAEAEWQGVLLNNLRSVLTTPDARDAVSSGTGTLRYRIPPVSLSGARRRGRVLLTSRRLLLCARGRAPESTPLARVRQALRFQNGVLVEIRGARGVLVASEDDRALETAVNRLAAP